MMLRRIATAFTMESLAVVFLVWLLGGLPWLSDDQQPTEPPKPKALEDLISLDAPQLPRFDHAPDERRHYTQQRLEHYAQRLSQSAREKVSAGAQAAYEELADDIARSDR